MKPSTPIFLLGLLITLLTTDGLQAREVTGEVRLESAYLDHWFSVDSTEPSNVTLTPLEEATIGVQAELQFTSDDGQIVNGIIAYPDEKHTASKLAFALHPMGSDQHFWWSNKSPLEANKLTESLTRNGYTVISLDARRHGARAIEGFGPRELLKRAHSNEPRLYTETIIGSVRDYRIVLNWAESTFEPEEILVIGYSMGAQMALLLASHEPSVDTIVAMVPPYVGSSTSPVAPRRNIARITDAKVLWLAGSEDPYSKVEETKETFATIKSDDKNIIWFNSGHRLPAEAIDTALQFIDTLTGQNTR